MISVVNGSNQEVAKLNLSNTAHQECCLKLVTNGTKMVMPAGVLKKAGTFTVSVPAGLIMDFAGNPTTAVTTTSFPCLAQLADTVAPTMVMMTPTGDAYVSSVTT